MMIFEPLARWQDDTGMTDADVAARIGAHRVTVLRAKYGQRRLGLIYQMRLQKLTGITPAQWTEYYVQMEKRSRK